MAPEGPFLEKEAKRGREGGACGEKRDRVTPEIDKISPPPNLYASERELKSLNLLYRVIHSNVNGWHVNTAYVSACPQLRKKLNTKEINYLNDIANI